MIESSWFHFLPVLKAFLFPHYFCPKSLHACGESSQKKEPDAVSAGEKQAATIPSNKYEAVPGWRAGIRRRNNRTWWKTQPASVCLFRVDKTKICANKYRARSKSSGKSVFTIPEAALHFQVNLLDHICHAVDELALVFSCVLHADVGYQDGAVLVVVVHDEDPVRKASEGLLVESH